MEAADKRNLIIGSLILLGLAGFGFYWYKQGKKGAVTQVKIPSDTGGSVGTTRIQQIADEIYTDVKGLNIFGHSDQPYNDALLLSNADFAQLYNIWNVKYQQEEGGDTLTAFVRSDYSNNDLMDTFMKRLASNNLP